MKFDDENLSLSQEKAPVKLRGKLHIVSTHIGNADDITERAKIVLKHCDYVICEEAKEASTLLRILKINKDLKEMNEQNEFEMLPELISDLENGKNLALISDCGTPIFADPGFQLLKNALSRPDSIEIIVVPGVTSIMTALVRSGFSLNQFLYAGFLDRKPLEREKEITKLANESRTVVLLETPYRLMPVLEAFKEIMPNRRVYIGCNLTMPFESHHYGNFAEMYDKFSENRFKGEFVIVFEGTESKIAYKDSDRSEERTQRLERSDRRENYGDRDRPRDSRRPQSGSDRYSKPFEKRERTPWAKSDEDGEERTERREHRSDDFRRRDSDFGSSERKKPYGYDRTKSHRIKRANSGGSYGGGRDRREGGFGGGERRDGGSGFGGGERRESSRSNFGSRERSEGREERPERREYKSDNFKRNDSDSRERKSYGDDRPKSNYGSRENSFGDRDRRDSGRDSYKGSDGGKSRFGKPSGGKKFKGKSNNRGR